MSTIFYDFQSRAAEAWQSMLKEKLKVLSGYLVGTHIELASLR